MDLFWVQIFADNTKFTESQVYIYVPTDASIQKSEITSCSIWRFGRLQIRWAILKMWNQDGFIDSMNSYVPVENDANEYPPLN
jgi:hypothetical protein